MSWTMATWMFVRQFVTVLFEHCNVSGRNLHMLGSSMMPSLAPSRISHWLRISLWIKVVHVEAEIKSDEVIEPVIGKKFARQDTKLLKSRAGDPATMPSKSLGNLCATSTP